MATNTLLPIIQNTDYMANGFELIGEPLNLLERGREWFAQAGRIENNGAESAGLVLGATVWLARLLSRTQRKVILVDSSGVMLDRAKADIVRLATNDPSGDFVFHQGNWLNLPELAGSLAIVAGDNSFSFLSYPDGWLALCDALADRMHPKGRLLTRVLSLPPTYQTASVEDIICRSLANDSINYTQIRAELLFAHWNSDTYGIETQLALETFEANLDRFEAIFRKYPVVANDLLTIRKYRDASAIYYAPPLDKVLEVFRTRFTVTDVHFGPYRLSQYFPLIDAVRD